MWKHVCMSIRLIWEIHNCFFPTRVFKMAILSFAFIVSKVWESVHPFLSPPFLPSALILLSGRMKMKRMRLLRELLLYWRFSLLKILIQERRNTSSLMNVDWNSWRHFDFRDESIRDTGDAVWVHSALVNDRWKIVLQFLFVIHMNRLIDFDEC